MGLFLSSGRFWFVTSSLFGAGKPFFIPSPVIRCSRPRGGGQRGPNTLAKLGGLPLRRRGSAFRSALTPEHGATINCDPASWIASGSGSVVPVRRRGSEGSSPLGRGSRAAHFT